jgi:NAD(P)-dependent dehydrogenase (short-subunit alcohol dehydrogenase family)
MDPHSFPDPRAQFPSHHGPRVWLITAGDSPIGISVARQALSHGDYVLLGLAHTILDRDERRRHGFDAFLAEVEEHRDEGWKQRMKTVPLDIRCAPHSSDRALLGATRDHSLSFSERIETYLYVDN